MTVWKQLLLYLYCYGSLPVRRWNLRCARARQQVPVMILFYHRIADDRPNAWTISNALFARQVRWLQQRFELVSLAAAQQRIRTGNRRPCVSITFDDGYADNCHQAIPLLIKSRIPCTYFVTLENVLHGRPFAHDLAQGHALAPNTLEQLREMASAGIEMGAHGYSHTDLATLDDPQQLRHEIVTARRQLQRLVERPVRYFAFPFGQHANLSVRGFEMARAAGYEAACSAYGGYNVPGEEAFHLQRIPADGVMARLKNWLTVDPRKRSIRRFQIAPARPDPAGRALCSGEPQP